MAHQGHKKHKNSLHKFLAGLDPKKPLDINQMIRVARAEGRLQTLPQIHAYKRLAKELRGEKRAEAKGYERLGRRTSKSVGSVYHSLAQEEAQNLASQQAIGNQLVTSQAQTGAAFGKGLAQGQSAQLGNYERSRAATGAPAGGQAQQQLAQIVAAQQSSAAADAKAAQGLAVSQAASSSQLAGGLAGSAALQGATAQAGIKTSILGRIAESNMKYGQDIREAKGKAADAKATKGAAVVQALQALRGQEQQYLLGKAATRQNAQAAKLSAQTQLQTNRQDNRTSRANNAATNATSRANNQADIRAQNQQSQQQSAADRKAAKKARRHDQQAVRHLVKQQIKSFGPPKSKKQIDALEHYIRTQGAFGDNEVNLVARIVHNLLKKKHHGGGGGGNPPPNI